MNKNVEEIKLRMNIVDKDLGIYKNLLKDNSKNK